MTRFLRLLVLAACAVVPVAAYADSTTVLPEFNGSASYPDPGPYEPPTVAGTFTIDPGVTGITISGTFGNSLTPNTAGADLYLGSILVAQCVEFDSCYYAQSPTTWSTTLTSSQLALLGTGVVDFTVVQTSQFWTRLGETTLIQTTTPPVPEPSTIILMATGALAAAGSVRRRLSI